MSVVRGALAVPGDLTTPTGGYRYDRIVLQTLHALGHDITHLQLGGSFPEPTAVDNAHAAEQLAKIAPDRPVLIDGLALGAMDHRALTAMRAPFIALVHHPLAEETGLTNERRAALAENERKNLALAAHVVVTSPHTEALLTAEYAIEPERITVARPGIEQPALPRAPVDPPLILAVGSQVWRKGHDVLIDALAQITDRPWQAVIVGAALDQSHAHSLAENIERHGLGNRLRLAGSLPADELEQLYSQAHVFALATRYEGHGMVLDEAMSHGLPIVSCDTGAVPDTLADGAGLLVPPEDPTAFGKALVRTLDDTDLHESLATASATAGRTLPDWTHTARTIAAVLERVASEHR